MGTARYTPDHAVSLRIASEVRIAPGGEQVVFTVAPIGHEETIPVAQLWLASVDGTINARPFTSGQANNHSPRWSPDGRTIAFLSDRARRGTGQVHVIDTHGGEARQVSDQHRGVEQIDWRPDGQALSGTVDRRALAGEQEPPTDFTVYSQSARPRVVAEFTPDNSTAPRVIGPAEGHVWAYAWRSDSAMLAALVTPSNLLDDTETVWLILVDPVTRAERELATFHRQPSDLSWSPDGRRLVAVGDTGRTKDEQAVIVVDAASGEVTVLDPGDTTPTRAGWSDASTLVVTAYDGQVTRIDQIDVASGSSKKLDLLPELSSLHSSEQATMSISANGEALAVVRTNPASPPEVWAGRIDDGQLAQLSDLNPQLDGIELAPMEPISWQGSDGLRIDGWLVTPPGYQRDRPLSLIADVHGGPASVWHATFHGTWHDWGQLFAAAGYAVLLPNPRGSLGRGAAFTAANRNDLGGMDLDDVMRGIDYLIEQGIADPERLGIAGWSYGGFLAAWAIGHTDRFKAAICGAAVTNWPSKVGTTDIRPFNEDRFAGPLHEEPDSAWERSPIRYLGRITTPTLVVHGEADPRVPLSQGMELYLGLKAVNVPTDFITYPRQKHSFHEKAHQRDVVRRILAWFREYLPVS